MKTFKVIDIIGTDSAILRRFGVQVFENIKENLKEGEVTLSFEGVKTANLPFFSALIGEVYSAFPNKAKKSLHLEDINDAFSKEELEEAIHFATHPDEAEAWNDSCVRAWDDSSIESAH